MSMAETDPRPQRDAARTSAAILHAAQQAFSTKGYLDTGVRDITAAAGVNPALVSRYFGSKEKLYEAALSQLLNADLVLSFPRDQFGEAVVRMLLAPAPQQRNPLPMMLLASADPTARAITDRLLTELFLEPMAQWYGPVRGAEKAACFALLASGLTLYRQVYPLAALGGGLSDETRGWLAGAFQSLID